MWPAVGVAAGGYVAVMLCAMVPLPSFNEVPGTLTGSEGLLLDGFRAEVLANFRLYSLMNEALMWSFIGVTWVCLAALPRLSANQPVAAGTRQL